MTATTEKRDYKLEVLEELKELAFQKSSSAKEFEEFQYLIRKVMVRIEEEQRLSQPIQ